MPSPDWGSVPAWLGLGTLLVALRVFLRDRQNAERSQVDLVGLWGVPTWKIKAPDADRRVDEGELKLFIRNANHVPVTVPYLAMDLDTKWMVPDPEHVLPDNEFDPTAPGPPAMTGPWVWTVTPGTGSLRQYIGNVLVPPDETWTNVTSFNVAHLAPPTATQLALFEGVSCRVTWALILDNAGRRWEVRPGVGKRARRIRWYSRRRRDYPLAWKRPATVWLVRRWYSAKETLTKRRDVKRR